MDETAIPLLDAHITNPIAFSYPNCTLAPAEEIDEIPPSWRSWHTELELRLELFPILRHGQFEAPLNSTFADPVSGIRERHPASRQTRHRDS